MIQHLPPQSALQKVSPELMAKFEKAQRSLPEAVFQSAYDLCAAACGSLEVQPRFLAALRETPLFPFANSTKAELVGVLSTLAAKVGMPPEVRPTILSEVADRIQLLRGFEAPDRVVDSVVDKVLAAAQRFPRTKGDIECGKNPGDVLDPFIVVAAQVLLYEDAFGQAIQGLEAHKALMMIEDLVGHLHEDVIGAMRGNVRVPEPRGVDQERMHPLTNPCPGADIAQPPWSANRRLRFYQVKSKTGSAKGGDGKRLGDQLNLLRRTYGGDTYYLALIGKTLRGHRSMAGVLGASPKTIVAVGEAAFVELTGSPNGSELLLRIYQVAFRRAAAKDRYSLTAAAKGIAEEFRRMAGGSDADFLLALLDDVTKGPATHQVSTLFLQQRAKPAKSAQKRKVG